MSRMVRIATCSVEHDMDENQARDRLPKRSLALAEQAGSMGADIVCLPEWSASEYEAKIFRWTATPVPGPVTDAFGEVARTFGMYVVVPLVEC